MEMEDARAEVGMEGGSCVKQKVEDKLGQPVITIGDGNSSKSG
jgi:hypothetical protein